MTINPKILLLKGALKPAVGSSSLLLEDRRPGAPTDFLMATAGERLVDRSKRLG